MKSLLTALQDGRLIELPDTNKDKALEYLAVLIEAIPDIESGLDLVKQITDREAQANTGIGMGVACPHARSSKEGELHCAVGWSPLGIEYGSPDGKKVHLIVMYYIPDIRRNDYLKEISSLAKAIKETSGIEQLESLEDINSLRATLLDWVEFAMDKGMPDSKARMIKLEEKHLVADKAAIPERPHIISFSVLLVNKSTPFVLSQNSSFTKVLETSDKLPSMLLAGGDFEVEGYKVAVSSSRSYEQQRLLFDCVAFAAK